MSFYTSLAILVLAGFVGYAVISKVPKALHTPLMSGTNAIHGIIMMGAIIVLGLDAAGVFNKVLIVIAVAFGTINVVGGFLVTDRMLEMFKPKTKQAVGPPGSPPAAGPGAGAEVGRGSGAAAPAAPVPSAPGDGAAR
jgi:NAD(P) transhydrogenase subunit alpha